ncbi:MAG: two-component sensor histidine kinase [Deltaproteobacteria bacterium]|nr:two-component sensor histidine kinase [Deltaproteobacteria bacterium]
MDGRDGTMKDTTPKEGHYARLFRKFIFLILVGSLIPHLLVGWGIYLYFSNFSDSRLKESFHRQVEDHRKIVELFLQERTTNLQLIAQTHSLDYLRKPENLHSVFSALNQRGRAFIDLGVIDRQGKHLSYIGPYPLMDKAYSQTFWFKEVMKKGVFISDMFMGFRNTPHFIIAFLRQEGNQRWILRASIDTEYFRSLVEKVKIGTTGEAVLINQSGLFQTSPRFTGTIMGKAPLSMGVFHQDSGIEIMSGPDGSPQAPRPRQIVAYAWLKDPRWLLVIKQDYSEAFSAVNRANWATLIFLFFSSLGILVITIVITYFIIKMIRKRDDTTRQLNDQLLQASKLASIGELSAKVAHELNSPLGGILIYANLLLEDTPPEDPKQNDLKEIINQALRCKDIVKDLLEFSRQSNHRRLPCSLNQSIRQAVDLLSKQALFNSPLFLGPIVQPDIEVVQEVDPDLPLITADPNRLNQILVNLIINAVDAMEGKGTLTLRTFQRPLEKKVVLEVSDTGMGIPEENLSRIFDPFFTTKEVGKGTGLGLSTVYGIVRQHGGTIEVQSTVGKGTTFILTFPFEDLKSFEVSSE